MSVPTTSRRLLLRLAAGAALAGVLGAWPDLAAETASAAQTARDQTDDFASALLLDRPRAGHLDAGRRGGRFAYYRFYYAADGSTATVNVQMWPDDAAVLKNAGITIFGPRPNRQYVAGGQTPGVRPNVSGNVISHDPNDRGVYTVQVYNYDPNAAIDFTIEAVGAAAPPSAVAAPGPTAPSAPPPNTTADAATPIAGRHEGVLGPGGSDFRYFGFTYPGDESVVSINLQVTPDEALLLQNVGFHVYGPRPDLPPLLAGVRQGLIPNLSRDLIGRDAGAYVVQLFNYDPVRAVPFTLWATGLLPGDAPAAGAGR